MLANVNKKAAEKTRRTKEGVSGYLFILPSFLLLTLFHVVPILMTGYYSLHDYNVVQEPIFTGLSNYRRMINDPFTKASLFNTAVYTLVVVPVQTVLSMAIAYVLARITKNSWGQFVRSAMFIPVIASMILVTSIWRIMLSPNEGIVNQFLAFLRLPTFNWLGERWPALIAVCIIGIWKNTGYFLVIYYAGMMDISLTLYEAAEVDGANALQQFFHITLPMLRPITYLVVTLGTIWSFQVFDLVYTLTGGGPGRSTVTLVLTIYNAAFKEYTMGYASAISVLLLAIILAVSILQNALIAKEEGAIDEG